ncbi:MAG: alkylmercury lyase family protein [Desulfopila sp.]
MKIEKALARLMSVLPLKAKQQACGPELSKLHQKILSSFVENGRILTREEMAAHIDDVDEAVAVFKASDMVVFSERGEPVGAYPFTMEEREHRVVINGHTVNAMCALDALSVSPMFKMDTLVSSRCRVSGAPVSIEQSGNVIKNLAETADLQFGIVWGAASTCSCCANSLCMEMLFLRDAEVAKRWLAADHENREVFTLEEAVEFGSRFFVPLMNAQ